MGTRAQVQSMPSWVQWAAAALFVVVGCKRGVSLDSGPPSERVEASPSVTSSASAALTQSHEGAPKATASKRLVGLERIAKEPPPKAHALNAEGLELLRKGQHAQAIARFDAALTLAPEWLLFGYNRVCALALSGQLEVAATELSTLLWQDPANFGPRWRADADLAALRASSWMRALDTALAEAWADVRSAMPSAVSAQLRGVRYRTQPSGEELEERWVQPGVYAHSTRRFIALTPRSMAKSNEPFRPALAGALTDVNTGRVLVATGEGNNVDSPNIPLLELRLFELGNSEPTWTQRDESRSTLLEVLFADATVLERRYACWGGCGFGRPLEVGPKGIVKQDKLSDPGSVRLRVNQAQVYPVHGTAPGFSLHGDLLTTPVDKISLPKSPFADAHTDPLRSVAINPDRSLVFVIELWADHTASGMMDEPSRERVLAVDLTSKSVRVISQGAGWASVAFDASAALYLEHNGSVVRFADPRKADSEPTLAGISL